jgi:hypothetical protein
MSKSEKAKKKPRRECTINELKAIEHFVAHGNKTEAYRHAYAYKNQKDSTIHRNAVSVFSRKHVISKVQRLLKSAEKKTKASLEDIFDVMTKAVLLNPKGLYDENGNIKSIKDIPNDIAIAIESIESVEIGQGKGAIKKVRFIPKTAVMTNFLKHYKALNEVAEEENSKTATTVNIILDAGDD